MWDRTDRNTKELQEHRHCNLGEMDVFFPFFSTVILQTANITPQCSGLKKQKADASVIKTIKLAAAPSAIVRDRSNEWEKESKRDFEKVVQVRP